MGKQEQLWERLVELNEKCLNAGGNLNYLYDILAMLRGPDNDSIEGLKRLTTGRIREVVLGYDVCEALGLVCTGILGQYAIQYRDRLLKELGETHFTIHYYRAVNDIYDAFGYDLVAERKKNT